MSEANLGWLYYKEMYRRGEDDTHIKKIFDRVVTQGKSDESLEKELSFTLTTMYPGLIIGSGYAHGIKSEEDAKLGFYFDFTSGLPTLPGSAVKGVLRSLFGYSDKERYKKEKQEFIRDLLKKGNINVDTLAEEIFEGKKEGKPLNIYKRDKFYEARIVSHAGSILQEDYITPHKDPLKSPVPIKMVKIGGGTTFEFSFELHACEVDGISISAAEKLQLFFKLLQFHGMGAKTNVGYGQFQEKTVEKLTSEITIKQEKLKEQLQKEQEKARELKQEEALKKALDNAENIVDEIMIKIKFLDDNKEVYEVLTAYALETLENEDKNRLLEAISKKVGQKPEKSPKTMKKAKTKWPIKIYELLGLECL